MQFNRGEIVWDDFPFTDNSQTKPRPALIISNSRVNATGDYILLQITSRIKQDGLSIEIKAGDYSESPLEIKSFIRLYKIFVLNESLILHKKTSVTQPFVNHIVEEALKLLR